MGYQHIARSMEIRFGASDPQDVHIGSERDNSNDEISYPATNRQLIPILKCHDNSPLSHKALGVYRWRLQAPRYCEMAVCHPRHLHVYPIFCADPPARE